MKIVVGLGNPGVGYENNRHNVGFMAVDRLAGRLGLLPENWESKFDSLLMKTAEFILVKPQTFMNKSGEAVARVVSFYKAGPADLIIIHDDLDIRLGEYKIQAGVGPKVHNGLTSVEERLGKKDFWRVRIGVDNRPVGEARTPGDEYVLADFLSEERSIINEVVGKAVGELLK